MTEKKYFVTCNSWYGEALAYDTEEEARKEIEERLYDDAMCGNQGYVYSIYVGEVVTHAKLPATPTIEYFTN